MRRRLAFVGVPSESDGRCDVGYLGYCTRVRVRIENLGAIRTAEFELRPLTVFIGPNATHKTWVAYALYGLLGSLGSKWPRSRISPGAIGLPPSLAGALDNQVNEWTERIQSEHPHSIQLEAARSAFPGAGAELEMSLGSAELAPFLGVDEAQIPSSRVSLAVQRSELHWADRLVAVVHREGLDWAELVDEHGVRVSRYAYASVGVTPSIDMLRLSLRDNLWRLVLPRNQRTLAFPAERKLLTLPSVRLRDEHLVAAALPDYQRFLEEAAAFARKGSERDSEIFEPQIMSKILGGRIAYEMTETGAALRYEPDSLGRGVPLEGTASLVKSLAGLSVYVQSYANPDDVLIIDEPEMNAHPEAIARLMELLAILVNSGVRVILTTHSPYVVDHLSNLVYASKLSDQPRKTLASKAGRLWLNDSRAILNPESLAVYSFLPSDTGVNVQPAFDEQEREIAWGTFSDVSNRMSEVFGEILNLESSQDH